MAQRRRAALSAGLEGVAGVGTAILKRADQDRQNAILVQRQTLDDLRTSVMKGEIEPAQADAAATSAGIRLAKGYFDNLQPSPERETERMIEGIGKAGTMQEVPGPISLATQFSRRRPLTSQQPDLSAPQTPMPGTDYDLLGMGSSEQEHPDFQNLMRIYNEKMNSFAPLKQSETLPTGETRDTYVPARSDQLTNRTFTTGLSDVLKGKNTGAGNVAQATEEQHPSGGGPSLGTIKGQTQHDTLLSGELSPEIQTQRAALAAKEATARKHAELTEEMRTFGMPAQLVPVTLTLSDNYEAASKEYFLREAAFRDMVQLSKNATTNPASGIGMVFKLMKLFDPTSTVREGEQGQARNTAPLVPDWLWLKWNSMLSGQGILDDTQVNQFLMSAKQIYEGEALGQKQRDQQFTERANTYKIPPHLVVRPPAPDVTSAAQSVGRPRVLSTDPNAGVPIR